MLLHLSTACQHVPRTVKLECKARLDTMRQKTGKRKADAKLEKQAAAKRAKASPNEAQSTFFKVMLMQLRMEAFRLMVQACLRYCDRRCL